MKLSVPSDGWLIRKSPNGKNKTRPGDRRAPGLISGVILTNELFRSTTLRASESQEVGACHLSPRGRRAAWEGGSGGKAGPWCEEREGLQDREMKMPRMRRRQHAGPSRLRSTLEAPARGGATDQMAAPAHPRD